MKKSFIAILVLAAASVSYAESRNIKREALQEARIEKGVQDGSLTEAEVKRLEAQQGRVDKAQEKAIADDGVLDKKEKAHIENMQDRASKNIRRERHGRITSLKN